MSEIKNPPRWLGSDKENVELMNYFAEKANQSNTLLNLSKLCKEFQTERHSRYSEKSLNSKIRAFRLRIHELDDLSNETKVRMLFTMSAPVDSGFLIELKKDADVEYDDVHRITKYEKKGGLKLVRDAVPPVRQFNTECDKNIMKFLAMKSEEDTTPVTDLDFAQEFKEITGSHKSYQTLRERYTLVKRQIYLSDEYDEPSRIRMMYVSSTKIHATILDELRKNGFVEVDARQRITYYKSHDGSLELGGESEKNGGDGVTVKQEVEENPRSSKRRRISKPRYNDDDDYDFENDTMYQSEGSEDESNKRSEVKNWVNSISTPGVTVKTEPKPFNARMVLKFNPMMTPSHPRTVGEIPFYDGQGPLIPSQSVHDTRLTRSDEQEYRRIYQSDPREFSGLKRFIGENQKVGNTSKIVSNGIQNSEVIQTPKVGLQKKEMIQTNKYLEWLRMFLISMDSPVLKEIQKKVDGAVEKCGDEKTLPLTNIISTLRTGVHIITKPTESTDPSTSVKDFLLNLHTTLLTLSSPNISIFQQEIKTTRVSFGDLDKQFPIDSIRPILETLLLLA